MTVRDHYFALTGGINDVDPPTTIAPGLARDAMNYEQGVHGGYRRIDGYERFDGRHPSPAGVQAWGVQIAAGTATPARGEYLRIRGELFEVLYDAYADSAGTVHVVAYPPDYSAFTGPLTPTQRAFRDTGTAALDFTPPTPGHEVLHAVPSVGPLGTTIPPGTLMGRLATQTGASGAPEMVPVVALGHRSVVISAARRDAISRMPGSGPVRGVVYFDGSVYAYRDNAAGTACVMHRGTETSWQVVATPALAPSGRYEFIVDNVYGDARRRRLYGVDGVNPAFEFDGTTFVQIANATAPNAPQHIAEYKRHLFVSFANGSLQYSELGNPLNFTAGPAQGGEVLTVSPITGLLVLPNDALLVLCRQHTYVLYGATPDEFNLTTHSDTTGALPYTVQRLGAALFADDRGLVAIEQVQAYGNFADATFSQQVAHFYRQMKSRITASVLVRDKNQYRVFFDDGQALYVTFDDRRVSGIMRARYPDAVRCVSNDETPDGSEIICFGSDAGYVYRMDSGPSFDGEPIEAYLRLAFNQLRSPEMRKRFRRLSFDVRSDTAGAVAVQPEFSYDGRENMQARLDYQQLLTSSVAWDRATWNDDQWSGESVQRVPVKIDGTGVNLGCTVYSKSQFDGAHTLYGATVHYTPRRRER